MKRLMALFLAAVLLLCLFGCGEKSERAGSTWVTYEEKEGTVKSTDNTDIFVYSYMQPVLQGTASGIHMINTKLDNATTAFLYGSGGVEELTELAKMDWQEAWFNCYSLERTVSTARLDEGVASFRYEDYVYNGGIHGNTHEYGLTYDMVTGEQLTLGGLTNDEAGLRLVCKQYILGVLGAEDFAHKDMLMDDYEAQIDSVMKSWVLTNEGLEFIAQPYIITPYALGMLRLTVPYDRIAHVMYEKYLPKEKGHGGGSVSVTQVEGSEPAAVNFVADQEGESLVVKVNGRIYDFSVEEIAAYKQRGIESHYIVRQKLYGAQVESESFGLQAAVPEEGAVYLLRWIDGSGTEQQYLLDYDAKHGAVLTELETQIE